MDRLFEGQHEFRLGDSCKTQITTVCDYITDSRDNSDKGDAIIIDFSKAFDLIFHDQLVREISALDWAIHRKLQQEDSYQRKSE
jgi:hypothetical protein